MQFIYLGEARLYEKRMSEFLTVSKNLEIKELSTGIGMNDQVESKENNVNQAYAVYRLGSVLVRLGQLTYLFAI